MKYKCGKCNTKEFKPAQWANSYEEDGERCTAITNGLKCNNCGTFYSQLDSIIDTDSPEVQLEKIKENSNIYGCLRNIPLDHNDALLVIDYIISLRNKNK